jgi:hypothetical protein
MRAYSVRYWLLMLSVFLGLIVKANAITFTNDVTITARNTNFDGTDVVVSNCVLTVDGVHTFASLQVVSGGKLTHSPGTNGVLIGGFNVTGEAQQLTGTNAQALFYPYANVYSIVVSDSTGQIVYTNNADYLVISDSVNVTIQRTDTSEIPDGATVLVSYQVVDLSVSTGLKLSINGDVSVDAGAAINVDGRGYGGNSGTGRGGSGGNPLSGCGGWHGGDGGVGAGGGTSGIAYDNKIQPTDKGSSGGSGYEGVGGVGGGAIQLTVGGVLHVNGTVTANGANGITSRSGGGSGGSIWLNVQSIDGNGTIAADGGSGEPASGGGGGGGMIALYYGINSFSGKISNHGGKGYMAGGAGTIYSKGTNDPSGQLLIDNGGRVGAATLIVPSTLFDLAVTNGGFVRNTVPLTFRDLLIASNGFFSLSGQQITVTRDATVQLGGGIVADSRGYAGGQGQGAGRFTSNSGLVGSGGTHGGFGGGGFGITQTGIYYDSITQPSMSGSGGGVNPLFPAGSEGGGIVRLDVAGNLRVDGRISADGDDGLSQGTGGGAGGSIWLTAGGLSGSGVISASGGAGNGLGGGGGGGRIAIYPQSSNSFTGTIKAWGGGGGWVGGAGTIYISDSSVPTKVSTQLILDNGGRVGTNTVIVGISTAVDWVVRGGAVTSPSQSVMGNLLVGSNSSLSLSNFSLTVTGTATVEQGGVISGDGFGSTGGQGNGAGKTTTLNQSSVGGGGGYGGLGATVPGATIDAGGGSYGSLTQPIDRGSGGGNISGPIPNVGGTGGGTIHLTVSGMLRNDGTITANGTAGVPLNSGGGSGGSIWLTLGGFSGGGTVTANGGAGNGFGGAGAGGRIAIYYQSNFFDGSLQARAAGSGTNYAGAGTIYIQPPNGTSQVVIDNGGGSGRYTTFGTGGTIPLSDLSINGGAKMLISSAPNLRNLLVTSNSWLSVSNVGPTAFVMNISGSATIQAGGGIIADEMGNLANQGLGAGRTITSPFFSGGGGGYGGQGAPGSSLAAGGVSYGSLTQPVDKGSGGGGSGQTGGSAGGGAIRLAVTDTLIVDGRISADGGNATTQANGAGSGGSIWLTAGKLSGSGVISASGGAASAIGGGGGAGRIALYYQSNNFSGVVKAFGGIGGNGYGGAGTIYSKPNQGPEQLVINNGGNPGQYTGFGSGASSVDVSLQNGAILYPTISTPIHNLLVASNAFVVLTNVPLSLSGDVTIEAGGGIVANAMGSPSGQGTGAGQKFSDKITTTGGGGGHGGFGGNGSGGAAGGNTYDSFTQPLGPGSGGGTGSGNAPTNYGGAGGGFIRLTTPGNLRVDGRISAEGGAGIGEGSGGGSGGSIWLDVRSLSGAGTISANGGAGGGTGYGTGGGGGGGRIAVYYNTSNNFSGTISAYGGNGATIGGAGTIYSKQASKTGALVVDNGGGFGTNTPLSFSTAVDLAVRNGAFAYPTSGSCVLSNLVVDAGGTILGLKTQTNLDIAVLGNATIQTGGTIAVDGLGYQVAGGPGVGVSHVLGIGSGGGYGGRGGASSLTPGGLTYGSAQQPLDRGSGGGFGWQQSTNGGAGGGAIRLNVAGTLTVDGRIGADGTAAQQDDGGGGSGGSVWVNASAITGAGFITAEGGDGELYEGGGGGGGRIAIYSPSNSFAGTVSTVGGEGFYPGEAGSIYYSSNLVSPAVIAQTPTGVISNGLISMDLFFNTALKPGLSISNISLSTPNGILPAGAVSVSVQGISRLRVDFPVQLVSGDYVLNIGTEPVDIYGQSLLAGYTGGFTISMPVIQGTITDTNGQPVAGVLLQPDGGFASTTTDSNGNYVLEVLSGYTVTVTPVKSGTIFVPSSMTFTNLGTSISNQNYVAYSTVAPSVVSGVQGTNDVLSWYGISQMKYQAQYSSNLVDWVNYGNVMTGSNAVLQLSIPTGTNGTGFFRLRATY